MNTSIIDTLEYHEIFEITMNSYIKEFGERKFRKIFNKMMTSNKISGLISTARHKGVPPGSKDFLYSLNEIPYFIFSRGQTQAVAALIGLQRWNEEVNIHQMLLDGEGLKLRAINILKECRKMSF